MVVRFVGDPTGYVAFQNYMGRDSGGWIKATIGDDADREVWINLSMAYLVEDGDE